MQWKLWSAALVLLIPNGASMVQRPRDNGPSAVTTSHGVQLTVSLSKSSYPRNALVPVVVRIQNVSRRSLVRLPGCDKPNPDVQAVSPQGDVRYMQPIRPIAPLQCVKGARAKILLPGDAFQEQHLIVLRAKLVRAAWTFGTPSPAGMVVRTITSRPVPLTLISTREAAARVHSSPSVYADVARSPGGMGPLRYAQVAKCQTARGPEYVQDVVDWQTTEGPRLSPPCSNPLEWHAIAGYVNQPVATIDYVK